ncbi:hypothetical protein ACKUB1_09695 [Methanospirillum stamsii]|uniref:Uncharacterized protein n=1 Tax=Methanospirillum stamsii TaxID=1277351 RepID=A0A2V2NG55_9EURY|nr:hypothetical protein [Methanospirillum stamsii]PWR75358.1 hypothetical protein DLD82_04275 [Methanospirillum stamsii]
MPQMKKISITLPEELINAVTAVHPEAPLSKAIALELQKSLQADPAPSILTTHQEQTAPTLTPDLINQIRDMVREEMRVTPTSGTTEPTIVTDPIIIQSDSEWLTNGDVAAMLPADIPIGTRSSRVSRAVSKKLLITKPGNSKQISRESALAWVTSQS